MNPPSDALTTAPAQSPALGRYEVVRKLGEGGMGAVYLARDAKLDRLVAVKVLPDQSVNDAEAVARFQREARALAKLAHPGIIQAHDSGQSGSLHFLVMEYVEGRSLADVLAEKGPLPPGRAADFAHQAALALAHAHEAGLIHRDVKPANLLLTAQGQVKLLDLGLARFLQDQVTDPSRTREGVGMGTPDYVAPEQFADAHKADVRSDVYSLGCTLYLMLTGQVPFPGSSLSEKYEAHRSRESRPVEELCPDVPAGLALAVARMMAKRPEDRFQSMREVAEALAPYVAGSSASFQTFRKTTTWERGQLTTPTLRPRRVRRLLISAAVVALVGLAALGGWAVRDRVLGGGRGQERVEQTIPDETPSELPQEKDDPNVLTVAKTGRAKYQTINAALEAAKPGMTIRVLDDATYDERVVLVGPLCKDLTLEAVGGARIHLPTRENLIVIRNAPGITLRGFRLGGREVGKCLVLVDGQCAGAVLERLRCTNPDSTFAAVEVAGSMDRGSSPIVIRGCEFDRVNIALTVFGTLKGKASQTGDVLFLDNFVKASMRAVMVLGDVRRVCVAGNRVWGAGLTGFQLQHLSPESEDVLLANNTTFASAEGFRVWDRAVQGKGVRVCNNLFLASTRADMTYFDSGGDGDNAKGPGDFAALRQGWKFEHNWREGKRPAENRFAQFWMPPTSADVRHDHIDGVERDPQSPDFLRPEKGSPLATQGAGNTDPNLPRYVGALPPTGEEAWDWQKAWEALARRKR